MPRCKPVEGRHGAGAGHDGGLDHLGDRADLGELTVVAGQHENARLVADLGGDRRGHVGEEDGVVEGNQEKSHARSLQVV